MDSSERKVSDLPDDRRLRNWYFREERRSQKGGRNGRGVEWICQSIEGRSGKDQWNHIRRKSWRYREVCAWHGAGRKSIQDC